MAITMRGESQKASRLVLISIIGERGRRAPPPPLQSRPYQLERTGYSPSMALPSPLIFSASHRSLAVVASPPRLVALLPG